MALLDRAPRNATVTALTPMQLLVVGQREFGALMDESPGFARPILATLSARLRAKDASLYG
jgi:CRP-like cAMP-binding protein